MLGLYVGTPVTQHGATRIRYGPGWLRPDYGARPIHGVVLYPSLLECCIDRQVRSVGLYRTYALGDILLLIPVVRHLAVYLGLEQVKIITTRDYAKLLAPVNREDPLIRFVWDRGVRGETVYGCDVHYDLNSVLEVDHAGGPESNHHRVDLYARAIGFNGAVAR